jgi:hypothetical protein
VAKNPDPALELVTSKGVSRTLDDWSTMFHLFLVILPDRPEAAAWIPVARRIFAVLGDSDCRVAYVVTSTAQIAQRILGDEEKTAMTFIDPDRTTIGAVAVGWNPAEWQTVAREVGRAMAWSIPEIAPTGEIAPAPSAGWAV